MRIQLRKPLALGLSAALLMGCSAGITAYAVEKKESTQDVQTEQSQENTTDTLSTVLSAGEETLSKDETVYVLADADGSVQKIIVSDWIRNPEGESQISDTSNLSDVQVLKGDATYTMDQDNMRVWDTAGSDVQYQGTSDTTLPVCLGVSYTLDGKVVSADELAGKSGHVTIRFDYENTQYEMVSIDGVTQKIYVPFVMLTGMLLDDEVFSNVEITNGRLISDGTHDIAVGFALPGMQENLNLSKDKLELPDYVEISADVENFTLGNTVTLATNSLFNEVDTSQLNSLDDVKNALGQLTEGMDALLDGSSQLYDGMSELVEKSGNLISGIDQLASGAQQLESGMAAADSGAAQLDQGAAELADGLNTLDANSSALNQGAEQIFNTLLTTAQQQITAAGLTVPTLTIDNYATVLNSVIASLDETNVAQQAQAQALQTVTAEVERNRSTIEAAVTSAVKQSVTDQVTQAVQERVEESILSAMGMSKAQYDAGVAAGTITSAQVSAVGSQISAQMATASVQSQIQSSVDAQMESQTVLDTISAQTDAKIQELIEENMNTPEVQNGITQALQTAKSGAAQISALKGQLDSYASFYNGLKSYTAGVSEASTGASSLSDGATELHEGTTELLQGVEQLLNGILQMKDGAPTLEEGENQLKDGAMQLQSGLEQFKEEGIDKIVSVIDGDLGNLSTRIQAMADVSKDYNSFSGLSDGMNGSVKFIYRTSEISQ